MTDSGAIPVELTYSGAIPADSGAILVDSGAIPVDSGQNLWSTEKYSKMCTNSCLVEYFAFFS
jgi:hypothetical protein